MVVLFLLPLAGCAMLDPRQADPKSPGIARTETIMVDGLPEHLLIRGDDPVRNPVLRPPLEQPADFLAKMRKVREQTRTPR